MWVREQCTGLTKQCNFNGNFTVKEVVGPVHSAQDPLIDNIPHDGALLNKKRKKKKGKRKCTTASCNPNAYFSVFLAKIIFANLFYYLAHFFYYSWLSLHFLLLFINLTVLFQLIFTFIYNTFSKISRFQTYTYLKISFLAS